MELMVVFLLLVAVAGASLNDNGIEDGDRVVLVAPVLAPPRDSRTHMTDRSRQFPILVLLAQQNPVQPEPKSLTVNPEPVYVQKLDDQEISRPHKKYRAKRYLKNKNKGGFGGGNGRRYRVGHGGGYQQQPQAVPVVVVLVTPTEKHQGGSGYGGHGGGSTPLIGHGQYNGGGCGGGCRQPSSGGGSSFASAFAVANANGKR